MKGKLYTASAVTLVFCLVNQPARAQDSTADTAPSDPVAATAAAQDTGSANSDVGDIIVTAQRRRENAQDVPISLSAISSDQLARSNTASLQDLAASIPGVVVSQSVSYGLAPIAIRGIGGPAGGGSLLTDQPVAVYADGVYVRALGQSVSDFLDVDTIQVLRGPQGTLYGRNSTAGAILVSTKRPGTFTEGYVRAGYGSFDEFKLAGAANTPLIDGVLAMRVAGAFRTGGDWAKNSIDDRKFGGGRSASGRISFRLTPNDRLTFDLIGELSRGKDRPATLQLATIELARPIPVLPLQLYAGDPHARRVDYKDVLDSRDLQIIGKQYSKTRSENVTLLADWEVGDGVTLSSVSGYRHFQVNGFQDTTPWIVGALPGTPGAAFWNNLTGTPPLGGQGDSLQVNPDSGIFSLGWNQSDQDYKSWSQELRLASDKGPFKWTVGAYYAREKVDGFIRIVNEQGGPPMLVLPAPGVVPGSAAGLDLGFGTNQTTNVYALFADGTLELGSGWSLTGGLRYSRDKKEASVMTTTQTLRPSVVPPLDAGITQSCPGVTNDCEATFNKLTPRLVVSYQPSRDHMLYASWARGFTSGGFNNFGDISGTLPDRPLEVGSETITNYELGTKNEFLDRRARLNLSLFQADYSNLQIRQAVNTGGVAIVNVPKARIRGIELESMLRATDRLTFTVSGSWLDAKIRKGTLFGFPDSLGTIVMGSLQTPTPADVSGNHMTRAPKWLGNASAEYRLPTSFGYVAASAALQFQSKTYFSEVNQGIDQFTSAGWEEVSLRLAAATDDQKWEVAVYVNNLFDRRYATQIVPFFILPNATLNTPRSIGVSLSLKF